MAEYVAGQVITDWGIIILISILLIVHITTALYIFHVIKNQNSLVTHALVDRIVEQALENYILNERMGEILDEKKSFIHSHKRV